MKVFQNLILSLSFLLFYSCGGEKKGIIKTCCFHSSHQITFINLEEEAPKNAPEGMIWVFSGEFTMGSLHPEADFNEMSLERVKIKGFWMDKTEVTNAQFQKFVDATGYITLAEKGIDWEEFKQNLAPNTPKPPDSVLAAGSLVFTPTEHPVNLNQFELWWTWTKGADWQHPEGAHSNLQGRENHPVVHIAYEDALAYCEWAGKRLPTEAEWEYAAKGNRTQPKYVWGNETLSASTPQANTWEGKFPYQNSQEDGYTRTAPVGSYASNDFGLYDMAGNVWEWTQDDYNAQEKIIKGGSFLCSDVYCSSYRPSAKRGGSVDTGTSHIGFRCVKDIE